MSEIPLHPSRLDAGAVSNHSDHFLVVEVGGDRYGLLLSQVREVLRAVWIDPLPDAPAIIMGLIDIRGRFTPVVDMRRRTGRLSPPLTLSERFVVAWTGEREIAIRCDTVASEFVAVDTSGVERVEDVMRRGSHVTGLAHTPDGLLLVQDLEGFLTEAESAELDAALVALQSAASG